MGKTASQYQKKAALETPLPFKRTVLQTSASFSPHAIAFSSPAKPSTVTSNSVEAYCDSHLIRGSRLGSCAHTISTLRFRLSSTMIPFAAAQALASARARATVRNDDHRRSGLKARRPMRAISSK